MCGRSLLILLGLFSVPSEALFGFRSHCAHHERLAPVVSRFPVSKLAVRGGSTQILDSDDKDEEEGEEEQVDPEEEKRRLAVQKWRMEQQMLMQLRSTFLSEALAKRGIPIVSITDVSTAEGDKPPEKVDWDCAMSTVRRA